MCVYLPENPDLISRLQKPEQLLVVCYCAAWCDTCKQYQPKLEELAQRMPEATFVWVDIEDHPDLLDDHDVENFPTVLLERSGQPLFFGTILPHIGQLERLIGALHDQSTPGTEPAPDDVRQLLLETLRKAAR